MTVDQPRPYRVRLYEGLQPPRQDQWYLVDLDLREGEPLLWSKRQLAAVFAQVTILSGIQPNHRDYRRFQLRVTDHPTDRNPWWWVPGADEPWLL